MNVSHGDRTNLRDGTVLRQIVDRRHEPKSAEMLPATAFEAVTRQMVLDLTSEIRSLRTRIDSLLSVVVGAIILDLLLRLAGWS